MKRVRFYVTPSGEVIDMDILPLHIEWTESVDIEFTYEELCATPPEIG